MTAEWQRLIRHRWSRRSGGRSRACGVEIEFKMIRQQSRHEYEKPAKRKEPLSEGA
jgi:hypothetical protein